jgi:hypothetical protein
MMALPPISLLVEVGGKVETLQSVGEVVLKLQSEIYTNNSRFRETILVNKYGT